MHMDAIDVCARIGTDEGVGVRGVRGRKMGLALLP